MKKKIYIHIGTQKAGSTAIQSFSSINYDHLLSNGVYYPLIGRYPPFVGKNDKVFINGDFLREKNYRSRLDKLLLEFRNNHCHTMLLSEEGLSAADPISEYNFEVYQDIKGFDVKIIVYLRRASEYLASFWQECVRNKILVTDLESFILTHEYRESLRKIHELSKIVGKENIIVRVFEKDSWLNNNLIDDFLSVLSVTNGNDFKQLGNDINTGMSRLKTEKISYLNRYLNNHKMQNEFDIKDGFLDDDVLSDRQRVIDSVSDQLIKNVTDKYYPDECEIAKTYLGRDELFITRYPTVYGTDRQTYQGLTSEVERALIGYISQQKPNRRTM